MVQNLENEIWKPIAGYSEGYSVSNLGRVKAHAKSWNSGNNGQIFKEKPEVLLYLNDNRGYKRVVLTKYGKPKSITVHRLVAINFIPNQKNKPEINHKNGIKTDNRVENLEWSTPRDNQIHAYKTGLQVSQKRSEHSQAVRVKCDTFDLAFGCMRDAADALGLHWISVWKVCAGRLTQVKGLSFRYL